MHIYIYRRGLSLRGHTKMDGVPFGFPSKPSTIARIFWVISACPWSNAGAFALYILPLKVNQRAKEEAYLTFSPVPWALFVLKTLG